jgi:hypothetical protein
MEFTKIDYINKLKNRLSYILELTRLFLISSIELKQSY